MMEGKTVFLPYVQRILAFSTGVSPAGGKEARTALLCKLKEVFQRFEYPNRYKGLLRRSI
ncbi:arginyl-tRNA synthetase [Desmospora sp. 8437]|nr:arginyl-tRNA synthetase [Desmospora sp. 8437]